MMRTIGRISVFPKLPSSIARLQELAYNLWWSWEPDAQALYATIDPDLWEATNHNPVKFLRQVHQRRLDAVAEDAAYGRNYQAVMANFDAYMAADSPSWFNKVHAGKRDGVIAYFSAEFGLHEALPIYSGGLGILSGDHCKEASDLNLPFIGVGFLYPQGYFTQRIDPEGRQQAEYEKIDFAEMPVTAAKDTQGNDVMINVDLPGRTVYAKVWRIQVGRIPIYLMDTDVPRNAPQDRELSARLYGGDREMRISQEVVLGIGGVRAVRALGYQPATWHMNEGHSAFLGLERIRELIQNSGLTFDEAVEAVRANTLFTTHTPVPAGNDAFAFELVEKFFWQYWGQLGIDRDRFIHFAAQDLPWGPQYSMTVLALRLSAYANGVSKLHGEVSREMWQFLWPDTPVAQVPIGHITNGVHTKTWLAQELRELYGKYLAADWLEEVDDSQTWAAVEQIPDAELWAVHEARKQKMVDHVRARVKRQYLRYGEGPRRLNEAESLLDPHALTLGFARRFATYKRATLIFKDEERLLRLLTDPERPVQIVFSGKAHPADEPGKGLIQHIYHLSQRPEFLGKIVFVENYDMNIARHLVAGVDVWLNNPRRPHEASGTSGQKAALCGSPNFSVLDGWWVEGYNGENGWSIGEERDYKDEATQDDADVQDLYTTLEEIIVPLYYDRDAHGVPARWLRIMKNAIESCAPQFSMRRMVKDYTETYYLPAATNGSEFRANNFALARELAAWKAQLGHRWQSLHLQAESSGANQITVGDSLKVQAKLWLNGVDRAEVGVEIVAGTPANGAHLRDPIVMPMSVVGEESGALLYEGAITPTDSGVIALGVRARPVHAHLINPNETGINRWA
ncbi:MAG: alpha-glucan family phosphorylase [Caldilineaceae bacterium]|nr:alpha-glucan family phosphorylase [Caldilineaceae bacterium]